MKDVAPIPGQKGIRNAIGFGSVPRIRNAAGRLSFWLALAVLALPAYGDPCRFGHEDRAWAESALTDWTTARDMPGPSPLPEIVLFDSRCVWYLNSPMTREGGVEESLSAGDGIVTATGISHDGSFVLPNGESVPAEVASTITGNGRRPFLVMALPEIWRRDERFESDPDLLLHMRTVFVREMARAVRSPAPGHRRADQSVMDEIVVTASRAERAVRDATRSVSVVDRERIQNDTQQLGLDEALAGIPGLYMQNRYNFAQDLRVSLRGFGARTNFGIRGVRVIVDGIPETLPDGQANVDSIDLGSAQRIEVLRGPSSSLYGNASGGVIAIETERGEEPARVETVLAAGDLGYVKAQLEIGGKTQRADYLISVTRQQLDGYRDHSELRSTQLNSRSRFELTDRDSLTFVLNHTDQPTANDPGGLTAAQTKADPNSASRRNLLFDVGESLDQQRAGLVIDMLRESGRLTLRNHYVWRDFTSRLPFEAGGAVDLERFFWGMGVQYTLGELVPERLGLTVGLDLDRQDDDRRRFDNQHGSRGPVVFDQREQVASGGLFVHGQYRSDAGWVLSGGLRYDAITFEVSDRHLADGDDSGRIRFDHVSPSLALGYALGRGMLFGAISSSFETPTTTELADPDGSGGFNTELKPQTATSIEVGFKSGSARLDYELTLFHIDLEDELIPFEVPGSPGRTFFSNAGKSSRSGIESAISWTTSAGFGVDASYTWSDFTFDQFVNGEGYDYSGLRLPGLPEQFWYVALRYRTERGFSAAFETNYSGGLYADNANSVRVPSYFVSGIRAGYEFLRADWTLRPHVGVNNLFSTRYNDNVRINASGASYFEPAPERNVYAGLSVTWRDVD